MRDVIIQARMGSTRLPKKVMRDIAGKPMLQRVVERCRLATQIDKVAVATSSESQDDVIAEFCEEKNIEYVRGSEDDVLERYFLAAKKLESQDIVRITSDCPLIMPETIDRAVRIYDETDADYCTNTLYYTYPDGIDVEVFPFKVLEEAHRNASKDEYKEHVTPYIRNQEKFDKVNFENPIDISRYSYTEEGVIPRWTVDYPEDLEFVRHVYENLLTEFGSHITQEAVHELLERSSESRSINEDRTRDDYHLNTVNEGET